MNTLARLAQWIVRHTSRESAPKVDRNGDPESLLEILDEVADRPRRRWFRRLR